MPSQIDPSKPAVGMALTSDVRANFYAAYTEITDLQEQVAVLEQGSGSNDLQAQIDTLREDVEALKSRRQAAASVVTYNPPDTSSNVFVTAGIGVNFNAQSQRMVIHVDGQLGNVQNGQGSEVQLVYGSGPSPAFGTQVSSTNGELIGGYAAIMAGRANDYTPFAIGALIEDLVVGSQYWIGIGFRALGGTATLSQMSLVAFEVLDPVS